MTFCAQCGTRLPEAARFCPSCGSAVPISEASAEPSALREPGSIPERQPSFLGSPDNRSEVEVIMPQMGESIIEGTITKWIKKVGEHVKRDEPVFEISTDKVDAEIPSPAEGVLIEIRVPEGQTVPIHTVVARIAEGKTFETLRPSPFASEKVASPPK